MNIEPFEYSQLKKEMDELDIELNNYLNINHLVYSKDKISDLGDKIIAWRTLVNKGIEAARRQETKDTWMKRIEEIQRKIDLIKIKYSK